MAAARVVGGRAGTTAEGTRGVAAGEGRNEAKHWLLGKQLEEEPQEQEVHIFEWEEGNAFKGAREKEEGS